jgi:hypothetical protein
MMGRFATLGNITLTKSCQSLESGILRDRDDHPFSDIGGKDREAIRLFEFTVCLFQEEVHTFSDDVWRSKSKVCLFKRRLDPRHRKISKADLLLHLQVDDKSQKNLRNASKKSHEAPSPEKTPKERGDSAEQKRRADE